jgi:AhpD family alkylhydroperoxidase
MSKFRRRLYANFGMFLADFRFIMSNRAQIHKAMGIELVSAAFRERLMLTVTQVNGCRYCSYFHAREALKAGISEQELKSLLGDNISEGCPSREYPALLFAQHWAETDAHPDPEATQKLVDIYGEEVVEAINIILTMIRMGNLLGNLWDYCLYRLSFGRFGLLENEKTIDELGDMITGQI